MTSVPAIGDRCRVEGLQKAAHHNGRYGLVGSIEGGERRGLRLGDATALSVKPQNLTVLPTPTLGIVLVGDPCSKIWREFLTLVLERRDAVACEPGPAAAYVAVLACVGPSGAVDPVRFC